MRRFLCIFLAVFIMCTTGCASLTGRTAGEIVDDASITTTINAHIVREPSLNYLKINVDSFRGNVTLTGVVPDWAAEKRIIDISTEVNGVKSVKSNLRVEPYHK